MREVEKRIIDTINSNRGGWFTLTVRDKVFNSVCNKFYYLWDNNIYAKLYDYKSIVERFSLCGYDTNTTRSRLNSLLTKGKVKKIKGEIYYIYEGGKVKINADDTYYVCDEGYLMRG